MQNLNLHPKIRKSFNQMKKRGNKFEEKIRKNPRPGFFALGEEIFALDQEFFALGEEIFALDQDFLP